MQPRGIVLILASFALWAELLALPMKGSAGSLPLSWLGGTGMHQPGEIPPRDECNNLPSKVKEDPVPGSKEAEMPPSQEGLASTDTLLPSRGATPIPRERPACKTRLGNKTEAAPAGKPQVGPMKKSLPGGESQAGGKAACETEDPVSCPDPASSETPGPSAGQTTPPKPLCSEKPISAGKLESPVTHLPHSSPSSDGQPTSGAKPTICGKPTSGGKPSADPGQGAPGKPTPDEKPAPHDRPGSSGKPAAEKPPAEKEPEEDADGDSDEGEDDDDNEDKEEEGEGEEEDDDDRYEGGNSIFSEDSDKGLEDPFDHELDYGLQNSPFNSNEYHDWWGGGDEEEFDAKPEGDAGGLSEEGGAGEEPVFDVWGDLVEKETRSRAWSDARRAGTASAEEE